MRMMEGRKKINKRSGILLAVGALILGLILLNPVFGYGKADTEAKSGIEMSVSYGLNGNIKNGRNVPIRFELTNQSDQDFEGYLQVFLKMNAQSSLLYKKEILLNSKMGRKEAMSVPFVGDSSQFYVQVVDKEGNEAAGELIKLRSPRSSAELFIGILSDSPESLNYGSGLKVMEGELSTRLITMDLEMITNRSLDLNLLDILLIDDYDTENLSENQIQAVMEWVGNGGILLLGTGKELDRTLSAFKPWLEDVEFSPESEIFLESDSYYSSVPLESVYEEAIYRELSAQKGKPVFWSDEKALITNLPLEKGIISLSGISFTEIEVFARKAPEFMSSLIAAVTGKSRMQNIQQEALVGLYSVYWSVNYLVNSGNTDLIPNPIFYTILIVLYIMLTGPCLYLWLKKNDKRQCYRKMVLAIAAGFSLLIYFLGTKTRFQEPFINYVTVKEIKDGHTDEVSYLNLRAPFNEKYSASFQPSFKVSPLVKEYYYYNTGEEDFTNYEAYTVAMELREEGTIASIQNVPAFTPQLFQLQRRIISDEIKQVEHNINIFEGQVKGKIKNNLGYDLEDAVILMEGQAIILGNLKEGQTIDLSLHEITVYPSIFAYDFAKKVTGLNKYQKPDIENPDYNLKYERTNLLKYYMDSLSPGTVSGIRLVGFSPNRNENAFTTDGELDAYGMTITSILLEPDFYKEDLLYKPALEDTPRLLSGDYTSDTNMIYGQEPIILEYSLGNKMDIEKVIFTLPNLEVDYTYHILFHGNVYFYNQNTLTFDKKRGIEGSYTKEELSDYISPNQAITVKYEASGDEDFRLDISLPVLSIVGRERNAENQ